MASNNGGDVLLAMADFKPLREKAQTHCDEQSFDCLVDQGNLLTKGHLKRTSFCVKEIAQELFKENKESDILSFSFVSLVPEASVLHDIGKLSIPPEILTKPSKLSPKEREMIETHTEKGAAIIEGIIKEEGKEDDLLLLAAQIAYSHHERWDGKGYPKGQRGKEIPLGGRITAVADVFDALVSYRPYKETYSSEDAFSLIASEAGTHFDPEVVSAFLAVKEKLKEQYLKWTDGADPGLRPSKTTE